MNKDLYVCNEQGQSCLGGVEFPIKMYVDDQELIQEMECPEIITITELITITMIFYSNINVHIPLLEQF